MTVYADLAGLEVGDGFPVRLVGALNVSPESFYQGSVAEGENSLRQKAEQMGAEGADVLDIGAMSTAPYLRAEIPEEEEIQRLAWAIGIARKAVAIPISADTRRSRVALVALDAGAEIVNDVGGLRHDPDMAEVVARRAKGIILVASGGIRARGIPSARCDISWRRACRPSGRRVFQRIAWSWTLGSGSSAGRHPWHRWDCEVVRRLADLRTLDHPVQVGLSRKSFIGEILGQADPAARLAGSLAATAIAVVNGAHLIRTHDVGPTREAVRMAEALHTG
jgi:dihydropteroate synthase